MHRNNNRIAALRAMQSNINRAINTLESNPPQAFHSLKNSISQIKVKQKKISVCLGTRVRSEVPFACVLFSRHDEMEVNEGETGVNDGEK